MKGSGTVQFSLSLGATAVAIVPIPLDAGGIVPVHVFCVSIDFAQLAHAAPRRDLVAIANLFPAKEKNAPT